MGYARALAALTIMLAASGTATASNGGSANPGASC
jgi:hypothetical protein